MIPWLLPLAIGTGRTGSSGQKPSGKDAGAGSWKSTLMHKNVKCQMGMARTTAGYARNGSGGDAGSGSVREGRTGLVTGWKMPPKDVHVLILRTYEYVT